MKNNLDYAFEAWVTKEYLHSNPRFIAIGKRIDDCKYFSPIPKPLVERYDKMKKELLESYCKDPIIKKQYKIYLAIQKMLETNL